MVALAILICAAFFYSISSRNRCVIFFLFLVKLVLTIGIYHFLYYSPLTIGDSLRTAFQNEELFDSNYYDFIAARIASRPALESIGLMYSTWNSFGVIFYISTLYTFFGTNTLIVVIFNVFIVSIGLLKLVESLNLKSNRQFVYVVLALFFMPYQIYHDATPSKESLTLGLFLLAIAAYYGKINGRKNNNLSSLICLTAVRPMLGVLLFVWVKRKSVRTSLKSVVLTIFGAVLFVVSSRIFLHVDILEYLRISNVFALNELAQDRLGLDGIKLRVFEFFGAKNLFTLLLWAPIRLLVWLILPFPLVEFPVFNLFYLNSSNWLLYVQSGQKVFRALGVFYYLPFLLIFLFRLKSYLRTDLGLLTIYMGILISSYTFINSSRYRLILEPLIIAQVLTGTNDKKSKSSIIPC